jgi:hypothetical protein
MHQERAAGSGAARVLPRNAGGSWGIVTRLGLGRGGRHAGQFTDAILGGAGRSP